MKGKCNPLSLGFADCLSGHPDLQESFMPLPYITTFDERLILDRQESLGEPLDRDFAPNFFKINADFPIPRNGYEGSAMGMRQIETQGGTIR
jgi:hypothetical protein